MAPMQASAFAVGVSMLCSCMLPTATVGHRLRQVDGHLHGEDGSLKPRYDMVIDLHGQDGSLKPRYEMVTDINKYLTLVLGKHLEAWYKDWKLWTGFCLWLCTWIKWLTRGYSGNYLWKAAYAFGMNLICLHLLQYGEADSLQRIMLFISGNSLFTIYIWWKPRNIVEKGSFNAQSLYQDVSAPLIQIVFIFVGQIFLVTFYINDLYIRIDRDSISFIFWLAAFFCMQMSAFFNRGADSYLGMPWPTAEWHNIIMQADSINFSCISFHDKTPQPPFMSRRSELVLRGIFGFMVNCIFRDILAFTIPILLCHLKTPMDFVVYCVGANFLVTMDDMEAKNFDVSAHEEEEEEPPVRGLFSSSLEQCHPGGPCDPRGTATLTGG